jgi:hypothetical protein
LPQRELAILGDRLTRAREQLVDRDRLVLALDAHQVELAEPIAVRRAASRVCGPTRQNTPYTLVRPSSREARFTASPTTV